VVTILASSAQAFFVQQFSKFVVIGVGGEELRAEV